MYYLLLLDFYIFLTVVYKPNHILFISLSTFITLLINRDNLQVSLVLI